MNFKSKQRLKLKRFKVTVNKNQWRKKAFKERKNYVICHPKLYIPSTPNNSNETNTFMCLGRTGRFGQR